MRDACAECDAAIDSLSLCKCRSETDTQQVLDSLSRLTAAVSRSSRAVALAHRRGAVALVSHWLRADDDAVVDAAVAAVASLASQDTRAARTYTFGQSGVALRLADGSQCDGLGWRAWRGALVLADLLVTCPQVVAGKRVVELGAGLGLAGLTAARVGALSVVLTDSEVSAALLDNVQRNDLQDAVRVRRLDWEDMGSDVGDASSLQTDVILGSDVVYGPEHAASLPRVVSAHLRHGGCALLVNGVRFPDVLHNFLSQLHAHGLDAMVALLPSDAPMNCSITFGEDGIDNADDLEDMSVTLQRVPHLVTLAWHSECARPEHTIGLQWMPAHNCESSWLDACGRQ